MRQRIRHLFLRLFNRRKGLIERSLILARHLPQLLLQIRNLLVKLLPCGLQGLKCIPLLWLSCQRIALLQVLLRCLHRLTRLGQVLCRFWRWALCFALQLARCFAQIVLLSRQRVGALLAWLGYLVNGLLLHCLLPRNNLIQLLANFPQGLEVFPRLLKLSDLRLQFFLRLSKRVNGRLLGQGVVFSLGQRLLGRLHLLRGFRD